MPVLHSFIFNTMTHSYIDCLKREKYVYIPTQKKYKSKNNIKLLTVMLSCTIIFVKTNKENESEISRAALEAVSLLSWAYLCHGHDTGVWHNRWCILLLDTYIT